MKLSVQFTANLVLENIDLPDDQAKAIIAHFEEHGSLTEEQLDIILNDQKADLFVDEVIEIDDVGETGTMMYDEEE